MKFRVAEEVFDRLPKVCFGVVVAREADNQLHRPEIEQLLAENVAGVEERLGGINIKEAPALVPYREAFRKLGINPNKFPSSIEAMVSRIVKHKGMPRINPLVDLANALSLKYLLPMGAHDLDSVPGDVVVRFAVTGDRFVPFGQAEAEEVEPGELIYVVGSTVKTRRWIWRQSELGKVTAASRNIFFPIDGFKGQNEEKVIAARDELAQQLVRLFGCSVQVGLVDKDHREWDL